MADIKVKLYDFQGKETGEEILDPKLFGVEADPEIVHEMVVAQQKNSRDVLAHTKGRAEVRGGGKKPWRQKGTGRARHGSIRSPLWIGGGITFGPTKLRNFSVKVNKKVKQKAKNRPALVVTKNAEENIVKASKNLPRVETINFGSLNLVDLMKKEYLVINKELLKKVSEHYI